MYGHAQLVLHFDISERTLCQHQADLVRLWVPLYVLRGPLVAGSCVLQMRQTSIGLAPTYLTCSNCAALIRG